MKIQDYVRKFIYIVIKLFALAYIFHFFGNKYDFFEEYKFYQKYLSFAIIYIIFFRRELKEDFYYYRILKSVSKNFGNISKREYTCIYQVLDVDNRHLKKFNEWIEGHEFLFSPREIDIMRFCWNL